MPFPSADVLRLVANIAASQTDSSLVAAVAATAIRVLSVVAVTGGTATNVTFNTKGSSAGVAISPLFALGVNGQLVLPERTRGWWDTNAGEALTVTTGAGATTGFLIDYVRLSDPDGVLGPGAALLQEDGSWLLQEDNEPILQE